MRDHILMVDATAVVGNASVHQVASHRGLGGHGGLASWASG